MPPPRPLSRSFAGATAERDPVTACAGHDLAVHVGVRPVVRDEFRPATSFPGSWRPGRARRPGAGLPRSGRESMPWPDRRRATLRRRAASFRSRPRVSARPGPGQRLPLRTGTGPKPALTAHGRPGRFQSLDSLADGVKMRCTWEPKSMIRAVPSSTPVTVPRPYLSWVILSPTVNRSAGGSGSGALNGLVAR